MDALRGRARLVGLPGGRDGVRQRWRRRRWRRSGRRWSGDGRHVRRRHGRLGGRSRQRRDWGDCRHCGTGGATSCNDGKLDPGEECEGSNLGGATCESLGLGAGQLSCDGFGCTYILWSCGCGGEVIGALPQQLQASTDPKLEAKVNSKCVMTVQGPSKFYRFVAASDMTLSAALSGAPDHYVSIRTACSLDALSGSPFSDELGCGFNGEAAAEAPLKAGDSVYLVVQSRNYAATPSKFTLDVTSK